MYTQEDEKGESSEPNKKFNARRDTQRRKKSSRNKETLLRKKEISLSSHEFENSVFAKLQRRISVGFRRICVYV